MRQGTTLRRDEAGVALVEFAFILPVLLILIAGIIELTRYLQFREKQEAASVQIINVINSYERIDASEMSAIFPALSELLLPFTSTNGKVMVSMVEKPAVTGKDCKPVVGWKYGSAASSIGAAGAVANVPEMNLADGGSVMVIETTATYQPLMNTGLTRELFNRDNDAIYVRKYAQARYAAFRFHPVTGNYINSPCR